MTTHIQGAYLARSIGFVVDVVVQRLECTSSDSFLTSYSLRRSLNLALFRALQAPIQILAWKNFDYATTILHLTGVQAVVFKVAADQTFLMPSSTVLFFLSQSALEGASLSEGIARVKAGFVPTASAALSFWPFVHLTTFGVIPTQHRISYSSVASVLWSAYISNKNDGLRFRDRNGG